MSILTAIAGWFLAQGIRAADWLLQDIGTARGEVAEHPDVIDEHADSAMAVLAGSDLIDAQVPAGTGERMAREIENYLRSIR